MPVMQTRRRFLSTAVMAGAAGLIRAPRALAAEGALETAAIRLTKIATLFRGPGCEKVAPAGQFEAG